MPTSEQSTTKVPATINKDDVVFTDLDYEGVLMNMRTKYYYSMNETAVEVWRALDDGLSEEAIVKHISDKYAVDASQCRQDIIDFIHALSQERLVSQP